MGINLGKTVFWTVIMTALFFFAGLSGEIFGIGLFGKEFFSAEAFFTLVVFMFSTMALVFIG